MSKNKPVMIFASLMVIFSLNGCSHVKRFFGMDEKPSTEANSKVQSANEDVLLINQRTYDLSNKAETEKALMDLTQKENEIKRKLSEFEQQDTQTMGGNPVQSQEPVFKNSEHIEVETIPVKKGDSSIFIQ